MDRQTTSCMTQTRVWVSGRVPTILQNIEIDSVSLHTRASWRSRPGVLFPIISIQHVLSNVGIGQKSTRAALKKLKRRLVTRRAKTGLHIYDGFFIWFCVTWFVCQIMLERDVRSFSELAKMGLHHLAHWQIYVTITSKDLSESIAFHTMDFLWFYLCLHNAWEILCTELLGISKDKTLSSSTIDRYTWDKICPLRNALHDSTHIIYLEIRSLFLVSIWNWHSYLEQKIYVAEKRKIRSVTEDNDLHVW